MATTTFTPPQCLFCEVKPVPMTVDQDGYQAWLDGELVQKAFPDFDADTREMFISGTHAECWERDMIDEPLA